MKTESETNRSGGIYKGKTSWSEISINDIRWLVNFILFAEIMSCGRFAFRSAHSPTAIGIKLRFSSFAFRLTTCLNGLERPEYFY